MTQPPANRRRNRPAPQDRPRPSDSGLRARAAALDLLGDVLRRHRPLDDAFNAHQGLPRLERRDRAFARNLAATTLRRLGQIDGLLAACLKKPFAARDAATEDILRLGACQLLFLGTPPHAAVDTAVTLLRGRKRGGHAALVNAVLRRLTREGAAMRDGQDAARLNTPDWLWAAWDAAYGEAACRRIAEAHLAEAPLDLSVKDGTESWAERLGAEILPGGTLRLTAHGPIPELPGYKDGAWWVQDAAAALPAKLLAVQPGETAFDLCAAPGGKTAQMAAAGAEVTALDSAEPRLVRLRENMARLELSVRTVAADAAEWTPPQPAGAVLLDAPCSATGTLRRHPDAARLKTPDDIAALTALQDRLLAAAVKMAKPGGRIVYCTCSLQPEEGPERIAGLIGGGAPVERMPIAPDEIGGLAEAITADGDLRTLPCHWGDRGGVDGFFACRLRRV